MKNIIIVAFIASFLLQSIDSAKAPLTKAEIKNMTEASCKQSMEDFFDDFDKTFSNEQDFKNKLKIFCDNKKKMNEKNKEYNSGKVHYISDTNKYSDMKPKDFSRLITPPLTDPYAQQMEEIIRNSSLNNRSKRQVFDGNNEIVTGDYNSATQTFSYPGVPDHINWVDLFNEVRDQGRCGSCWAYAAISLVEAYYKKLYNTTVTLSEQNLIDCIGDLTGKSGCDGAGLATGLIYIKHKGISTPESYPNTPAAGNCRADQVQKSDVKVVFPLISWIWGVANIEAHLKAYVAKGPVVVSINALSNFMNYKSGIYDDSECKGKSGANHAVVIVGYGTENGIDYWLIRNSWGKSWGINGYAKVRRGIKLCNIGSSAYQVAVGSETKPNKKIEITDKWTKDAPANYICDGKQHTGAGCKTRYTCEHRAVYQTDMACHEAPENMVYTDQWYKETGDLPGNAVNSKGYFIPKSWGATCNDSVLSNMKLPEGKDPKLPSSYSCQGLHGVFFLPGCRRFIICRKQMRTYNERTYYGNYYDDNTGQWLYNPEEWSYNHNTKGYSKLTNFKCSSDNKLTYDKCDVPGYPGYPSWNGTRYVVYKNIKCDKSVTTYDTELY